MIYTKSLQPDASYTYYKIHESHKLMMVEAIRFLTPLPCISFSQYDSNKLIEYKEVESILNTYPRISEEEYRTAYRLATAGKFDIQLRR